MFEYVHWSLQSVVMDYGRHLAVEERQVADASIRNQLDIMDLPDDRLVKLMVGKSDSSILNRLLTEEGSLIQD
jgi:hypothetical protein